jgi:hypothetical protein
MLSKGDSINSNDRYMVVLNATTVDLCTVLFFYCVDGSKRDV